MKHVTLFFIRLNILFFLVFITSCYKKEKQETPIIPPIAQQIAKVDTFHGEVITDNYFWLRGSDKPEVITYLKAENAYTENVTKHLKEEEKRLFKELKSRIKENDLSVPVKIDGYFYYTRVEEGKQYWSYCRRKGSMKAVEETILDVNDLAQGHDYFHVGFYQVSPDHKFLAYSIDSTGNENYSLLIKDLGSGELLKDHIENTSYSVVWANDNKTLFYNVQDQAKRSYKVYKHILGTDTKKDALVFHEKDEKFSTGPSKSKSKKYIFIYSGSTLTSEVRYISADTPEDKFKVFQSRVHGLEYDVDHQGDYFYILTNKDSAKNFKLMKTKISSTSMINWEDVFPYDKAINMTGIDAFENHVAISERINGLSKIRIINLKNHKSHYIDFPDPAYTLSGSSNVDYNTNLIRYSYTSLVRPRSVYEYNMDTKQSKLLKQNEVVGGYNSEEYETKRLFAKASDGVLIPISIVYKKGITLDANNPLYLNGYGSYGYSYDPTFSTNILSLLNRGFVYAIPHIRGGGEMGEEWHDEGKFLKKKNTFTDFITCAEYLIKEKYTNKDKLVISGGSAGGLLMGAVTNLRPDLFEVVVAKVPFVDVVNTMSDSTLPLTIGEYEEWGNPSDKEYYSYIKSYSPYDNVKEAAYPNMLITAGLNDPRVSYWEPAKWTAKLREKNKSNSKIILKTEMGAGHFGPSGRYDYLWEIAFEYAYIFDLLGIKSAPLKKQL